MSISSALSNALSGLTVSSRAADIVSANIANAMTPGYGVRALSVSARVLGPDGAGASVTGVTRHEDAVLVGTRRRTEAAAGHDAARHDHLTRLEALIGTPDQPGSLIARSAALEAALASAAAAPQEPARLAAAVQAATALSGALNTLSDGIQAERLQADADIARAVDTVNGALADLAALNLRLRQDAGAGRDVSALLDAQAQLVDRIAPLIPLESRRDATGGLQLYSSDGQALLDGRAAVLGFTPATVMAPDLRRGTGALSGLTLNGRALPLDGPAPALAGGALAAHFARRDAWGVAAQAQADALARDLAARFDAVPDPTRAPGAPGLFTDAGAAVGPAAETGLAARLRVNAAVTGPDAAWRLRDGLGAAAPGPSGAAGHLQALRDAMTAPRVAASGGFSSGARSLAGLLGDHLSAMGLPRQAAAAQQAHGAARLAALREAELAQGVDTDAEMQRLLRIEQVFAANARVISAAQEMLDQLMGIRR